jgi:starvation-inducible outer membrane lipoprotein
MLALLRSLKRNVTFALLLAMAIMLAGCATQDTPRLVDDPDDHRDSALPWNKQEKWETAGGQLAGMTDDRR